MKLATYFATLDIPKELQEIVEGIDIPGDCGSPQGVKPSWYDELLFKIGQQCAQKYAFGLAYSELLSLFLIFSQPFGLDPLISTGKSETPGKAFKRYLSTGLRVRSWYEGDPFEPSSKSWSNLVAVRNMHRNVRRMLENSSEDELKVKFTIGKDSKCPADRGIFCPLFPHIRKDTKHFPGFPKYDELMANRFKRKCFLSQFDMSETQFSFFGLFILRPDLFGAHDVTDKELEGLVHMWAVLGYCLGIEDRFNFCKGGLNETKKRSQLFLDHIARRSFSHLTAEWEHMSRCVITGLRSYLPRASPYEVDLIYLVEDVMGMKFPTLEKSLTLWDRWALWKLRFLMQTLTKVFPLINHYLGRAIEVIMKRAANLPQHRAKELEEKTFDFSVITAHY